MTTIFLMKFIPGSEASKALSLNFPGTAAPEGPTGRRSIKRLISELLESTIHRFMPLVTPAWQWHVSSAAAPEPGKSKRQGLGNRVIPFQPASEEGSYPACYWPIPWPMLFRVPVITYVPVYTAAATSKLPPGVESGITPTSDVAGSSQLETSEGSDDSFYELPALNSTEAKRWYVSRWNITNDLLLDDGFSCRILVDRVRSRAEHELELKEKLKGKYDARGRLLEEKDLEILRLKSLLAEEAEKAERAETAEVVRLRGQVSALTGEVSVLKSTIAQKDTDISLLDSRATYLKSALDDSKAAEQAGA
ncbi:hypothetical protein Tco_1004859 [Tanacetum coccineum]|uniref:Uncharacterized protein n=1 Tax=Tanacetum coccineum TaxID=301880 RepID=A0ABQ5FD25_9ASTR